MFKLSNYTLDREFVPVALFVDEFDLDTNRQNELESTRKTGDGLRKPFKLHLKCDKQFQNRVAKDDFIEEVTEAVAVGTELVYNGWRIPYEEGWVEVNLVGSNVNANVDIYLIPERLKYRLLAPDALLMGSTTVKLSDTYQLKDIKV